MKNDLIDIIIKYKALDARDKQLFLEIVGVNTSDTESPDAVASESISDMLRRSGVIRPNDLPRVGRMPITSTIVPYHLDNRLTDTVDSTSRFTWDTLGRSD